MHPLCVHIDVTHGTATPAQPDPQTIHLNPWPSEDVYFCPEEGLPVFVSGVPSLTSGSEVWVAIHNCLPEPLRLHTGQTVGTLEVVAVADAPPPPATSSPRRPPPVPAHLSPTQQQQLKALFQEFIDIVRQGEDDLGCTPLLQHTIETEGPRSASRIAIKTPLFDERRWPRSSRCYPAASSILPTAPGFHRLSWWRKRMAACGSVWTSGNSTWRQ